MFFSNLLAATVQAMVRNPTHPDQWVLSVSKALEQVRCPGLTSEADLISHLKGDILKTAPILAYKRRMPCLWIVFAGGTGTGKSTLFNALCGRPVSATGVERPRTYGPVAFVHQHCPMTGGLPLDGLEVTRLNRGAADSLPAPGAHGRLTVLCHDGEVWNHVVLVDTPDLDSVETANRQTAQDLCRLSDVVVFVTSQEKYADQVPSSFLARILETGKPCFLLLNKTQPPVSQEEVHRILEEHGLMLEKTELWLIPLLPSPEPEKIGGHSGFRDFRERLSSVSSPERLKGLREAELSALSASLAQDAGHLLGLLAREEERSLLWLKNLEQIHNEVGSQLMEGMKSRFVPETKEALNREIRTLFARYDVLAGPRRFVRELLLAPIRLLGFDRRSSDTLSKEALLKVRRQVDLDPVLRAVEKFHVRVLQELPAQDTSSPLSLGLRSPETALHEEEIRKLLWDAHEELERWLENTFLDLSRGLPAAKRWGIYTTSVLWGVLIVSFEVIVGGGFSILDAVLDSALAPFVTKGAAEIFAFREIRKIARELSERYQTALLSVLKEQRNRYAGCLQTLMTPRETAKKIEDLRREISSLPTSYEGFS